MSKALSFAAIHLSVAFIVVNASVASVRLQALYISVSPLRLLLGGNISDKREWPHQQHRVTVKNAHNALERCTAYRV